MERKKLTNETPASDMLAIVLDAIKDGTFTTDGPATATNHGIDGSIRYIETGVIDDVRVQITYGTTVDYDAWVDDCKQYQSILSTHNCKDLTGDETLSELQEMFDDYDDDDNDDDDDDNDDDDDEDAQAVYDMHEQYNGVPTKYAYYCNDESNNCDWDEPIAVDIIDDDD